MTTSEMAERFKFEFHVGIATAEEMATSMPEQEQAFNVPPPLRVSDPCKPTCLFQGGAGQLPFTCFPLGHCDVEAGHRRRGRGVLTVQNPPLGVERVGGMVFQSTQLPSPTPLSNPLHLLSRRNFDAIHTSDN